MKTRLILWLLSFFVINSLHASTWTVESVPNTKTQNARMYYSDPDNLMDETSKSTINRLLYNIEQTTSAEVFVVALESTGDVDIKTFATELFNTWGIGKDQKDNGLLILLVMDQKKITMETGYGMEGVLPDALCFRIIDNIMVPRVREGQVGDGMLKGVEAVSKVLSNPAAAEELRVDPAVLKEKRLERIKNTIYGILVAYLLLSCLILWLSVSSFRKKWSTNQQQDPYESYKNMQTAATTYNVLAFIFPLTMLPFFLYYSRRIKSLRKKPRICPKCGKLMQLMTEKQEDAYLSPGQQQEETVGSVDYDVWVCMDCNYRGVLAYDKSFTRYQTCPNCRFKTMAQVSDRIMLSPTPLSAGQGAHVFRCSNCGHETLKTFIIPMIVVLPSGRGGNGGFGGGGFGGGGFGGGSSGGGGATGGW